jgi:hypothetical protein
VSKSASTVSDLTIVFSCCCAAVHHMQWFPQSEASTASSRVQLSQEVRSDLLLLSDTSTGTRRSGMQSCCDAQHTCLTDQTMVAFQHTHKVSETLQNH